MRRIVVTGCGRSGTQYTAQLLRQLGIPTTHEQVFREDLSWDNFNHREVLARYRDKRTLVEVSWLAAPFVGMLPEDHVVWQQLRDPLKVIRCWYSHRLLEAGHQSPVKSYIHRFCPECNCQDHLEACVRYMLAWTKLATVDPGLPNCFQYRIESLSANQLHYQLLEVGWQCSLEQVETALAKVPPGVGSCPLGSHVEVTWSQILNLPYGYGRELKQLAERHGYDITA